MVEYLTLNHTLALYRIGYRVVRNKQALYLKGVCGLEFSKCNLKYETSPCIIFEIILSFKSWDTLVSYITPESQSVI